MKTKKFIEAVKMEISRQRQGPVSAWAQRKTRKPGLARLE